MTKRYGIGMILSLLLLGARMPPSQEHAETYTVHGDKFEVTLIPEKTTFLIGEPIRLTYVIKNLSHREIDMTIGSQPFSSPDRTGFRFMAKRDDGLKVLPPPGPRWNIGDVVQGTTRLAAGESSSVYRFLPQLFTMSTLSSFSPSEKYGLHFRQPGRYTLVCHNELAVYRNLLLDDIKSDEITTQTTAVLTILPANREAMAKVIEGLGRMATTDLGKSDDIPPAVQQATDSLNAIEDTRVIPWAVKMFHMSAFDRKSEAIDILSKFNDPIAFKTMQAGLTVKGTELLNYATTQEQKEGAKSLRAHAVYALGYSPYPRALAVLKTFVHDPDEEVRQYLTWTLTENKEPVRVRPLLLEMVHDPNKDIRNQVSSYLSLWFDKQGNLRKNVIQLKL